MKFIIDNMLGKCAKYLRMLGYDAIYPAPQKTHEVIRLANKENRILITRNKQLFAKHTKNTKFIYISSNNFTANFNTIVDTLHIQIDEQKLFTRCLQCNTPVQPIQKSYIKEQLPPKVREHFDNFTICPKCRKIFWRGGHTKRMLKKAKQIIKQNQ